MLMWQQQKKRRHHQGSLPARHCSSPASDESIALLHGMPHTTAQAAADLRPPIRPRASQPSSHLVLLQHLEAAAGTEALPLLHRLALVRQLVDERLPVRLPQLACLVDAQSHGGGVGCTVSVGTRLAKPDRGRRRSNSCDDDGGFRRRSGGGDRARRPPQTGPMSTDSSSLSTAGGGRAPRFDGTYLARPVRLPSPQDSSRRTTTRRTEASPRPRLLEREKPGPPRCAP
ncbi:unnamed protein product [Pedinophyceae sp. YPF-701]|nr:unnamed protein product [Pedinophyceae sp. YPF-701]